MERMDEISFIHGSDFNQFGKKVMISQVAFSFLENNFEVYEDIHTKLEPQQVKLIEKSIAASIQKKEALYCPPLIVSSRGGIKRMEKGWAVLPGRKLYILNGKESVLGFQSAICLLQEKIARAVGTNQPRLVKRLQTQMDQIRSYPLSLQIYLDLTQAEERKLVNDISIVENKLHIGVILQYEQRDGWTLISRKIAKNLESIMEIETEKSRLTEQSSAVTSLINLRKCLVTLFEGNVNGHDEKPPVSRQGVENIGEAFCLKWLELFPKRYGDRCRYVSGLSGIQISLALTVFRLVKKHKITYYEAIKRLVILKTACSWQHEDPLFEHLYDKTSGKVKNHASKKSIVQTSDTFLSVIERGRGSI